MFGAKSRKPTCISTNTKAGVDALRRECTHSRHETVLIGRREDGGFKTTPAARYPPELCHGVVEAHFPELLEQATCSDVVHGPELCEVLGAAVREAPERAGRRSPVKPALEWINPVGRWQEVFRVMWEHPEASNILESHIILLAVRHLARSRAHHGQRLVLFTDNLAALSVVSRGRSSAPALRYICRCLAAYALGCDLRLLLRWVESRRNHADGPSRQKKLGYYSQQSEVKAPGRAYHG